MPSGYQQHGVSGRKGSGKDTAAEGYHKERFSQGLKDMLRVYLFSWPGMTPDWCEGIIEGSMKESRSDFLCLASPREVMVAFGDCGRSVSPRFWIVPTFKRLQEIERADPDVPVIVVDVRMPEEAEAIRMAGGIMIEIVRGDPKPHRQQWWQFWRERLHPTETPLPRGLIDASIRNDGDVETLRQRFDHALVYAWAARQMRQAA